MKYFYQKGISVLEVLIVISIMAILVSIVIPGLSDFRKEQLIKNTVEDVVSLINRAKLDSNSSLGSSNYSVYFETNRVVYFKGTNFNEDDPLNEEILLNNGAKIKEENGINLNGGGNIITFPRLTNDVLGYGTIVLELEDISGYEKIININKLGSISVE